jgi:hypothetical protein
MTLYRFKKIKNQVYFSQPPTFVVRVMNSIELNYFFIFLYD